MGEQEQEQQQEQTETAVEDAQSNQSAVTLISQALDECENFDYDGSKAGEQVGSIAGHLTIALARIKAGDVGSYIG